MPRSGYLAFNGVNPIFFFFKKKKKENQVILKFLNFRVSNLHLKTSRAYHVFNLSYYEKKLH